MKTIVLLIFSLFILNVSCMKHDCGKPANTLTDAIITGNDLRMCACCGGLMITFSNDPKTYSATFYDIDKLPANSGITESSPFPIYVKVKYETSTGCGNKVNILQLERR
ncbi:MAG: hypothetical protein ACHQK8_03380 [Bacteroidia bacterium]